MKSKKKTVIPKELTKFDRLQMQEFTHDELVQMFKEEIERQASLGMISPAETKEYLANISNWILECMEN